MEKIIFTLVFLSVYSFFNAQKGLIGIGAASPQTVLDVVSAKNGILIPRQTAMQVQGIVNPDESEMVYSLTNDGTAINQKGFWFYQSGSWRPLLENLISNNNLFYSVDGALTSDRQVNMSGRPLNFGPNLLYIQTTPSGGINRIGILTGTPATSLDVNGDIRIQGLNVAGHVISDAQGLLIHDTEYFDIGDIKPSFATTDHDGWYLLDGRNITALPAIAQNNAASVLGITTTLPNATGRYSVGTVSIPGNFTGDNMITITQANLPAFDYDVTTAPAGIHSHNMTVERVRVTTMSGGGNNNEDFWLSGATAGLNSNHLPSTSVSGHTHTFSMPSGGNDTPIDIRPSALNANYFVYLGQ